MSRTILATCGALEQMRRILARAGDQGQTLTQAQVDARLALQTSDKVKRGQATYVIDTECTHDMLKVRVDALVALLRAEAPSTERVAVYAGTFDPFTNGHLWMIEHAACDYDRLIVAIGENPAKRPMFPTATRVEMIRASTAHLANVQVAVFTNMYLVRYAQSVGATRILRGIRNVQDFEYESAMLAINSQIAPEIGTVFLMPPADLASVSSSMVKGLIGPEGWQDLVRCYVPGPVFGAIKQATE